MVFGFTSSGILGASVTKLDSAKGVPRRLRGLPPAKSEAVCACAMVLRHVISQYEKAGHLIAEPRTVFSAPEALLISLFFLVLYFL